MIKFYPEKKTITRIVREHLDFDDVKTLQVKNDLYGFFESDTKSFLLHWVGLNRKFCKAEERKKPPLPRHSLAWVNFKD